MRKSLAALALAGAVVAGTAGCGPGGYPQSTYCVDQMGHVVTPNYCDSGYMGGSYMLFVGSVHNHSYRVGQTIPRSYITSGRQIRPSDTAARKSAGLPFSGSVGNGTKPVTTKPAAPQQAPKSPSAPFGGSSTKATTPKTTTTTKSSSSFGGFSSSRSSSGSSSRSSSGGRK